MTSEFDIATLTVAIMAAVGLTPTLRRYASRRLRPGDRIRLGGGLEHPAPWLSGRLHVEGVVHSLIGEQSPGIVVVRLSEYLQVDAPGRAAAGDFAVLQLRFRWARWGTREIVSVRLAGHAPSSVAEVAHLPLVESHAGYRRLK
jgi:hypothetical protein